MDKLRKGFIYSVYVPRERFSFDKPPIVLEHEELMKEKGGLQRDLTPEEAFMFYVGYQMGQIDMYYGYELDEVKEYVKG